IIAGRGRVGGIVDRILESAGYKSTVIDFSSVQLGRLQKFGINAYFGDATRPDLLRSAGIEEAKLLIVAIDDKEQITKLVQYAVHHYPDLHVIARACDRDHVYALWAAGCRDIIRETYDSSLRMGRSAFEAIGISRETSEEMVGIFRDADRKSMIEFADVYDPDIPSWDNEALIAKVRQLQEEWEPELREQIIAIRNRDSLE
ncbi:MAG: NAD-binding protein, partial [Pseudomonadota bacterium]